MSGWKYSPCAGRVVVDALDHNQLDNGLVHESLRYDFVGSRDHEFKRMGTGKNTVKETSTIQNEVPVSASHGVVSCQSNTPTVKKSKLTQPCSSSGYLAGTGLSYNL